MLVYIKCILLLSVISVGFSLYEDQIGKFDWYVKYQQFNICFSHTSGLTTWTLLMFR